MKIRQYVGRAVNVGMINEHAELPIIDLVFKGKNARRVYEHGDAP